MPGCIVSAGREPAHDLMKRLIDAYAKLFAETAEFGGDLARTAKFALENVHWEDSPNMPEASRHPITDEHLETACKRSGSKDSGATAVADALLTVSDRLHWRSSSKCHDDGPDIVRLQRNFAVAIVVGEGGLLSSDKVCTGFSLQAPDIYYPPHAHRAEESYFIIGGDADWRVGAKPWFAVEPGDSIYHEPWARHAMQTNGQPLLTIWLWTSHLDSDVLTVRD